MLRSLDAWLDSAAESGDEATFSAALQTLQGGVRRLGTPASRHPDGVRPGAARQTRAWRGRTPGGNEPGMACPPGRMPLGVPAHAQLLALVPLPGQAAVPLQPWWLL
jgi:hypothetical protein